MSKKIGSLYYEITGDTTKLGGALNNSKSQLAGFKAGLNDISRQLTGFDMTTVGVAAAIGFVAKETIDAVKETQAYNLAMTDLALRMKTTTEEASKLYQISDDLRLSQETLEMAFKTTTKNGIQPTIENLSKMADEYVSILDPVKKGQYAVEQFGQRAGPEMEKLLEKGGDGIRAMSDAIEDSLIVTDRAAAESKRFYEANDRLNDTLDGIKRRVGNDVIPALTVLINTGIDVNEWLNKYGLGWINVLNVIESAAKGINELTGLLGLNADEQSNSQVVIDNTTTKIDLLSGSLGIAGQSARDASWDVNGLRGSIDQLNSKDIYITTYTRTVDLDAGWLSESAQESMKYRSAKATMTQGQYNLLYGRGYAIGADFIVPPGFQNDSYPMRVQSGERVQVTPAGKQQAPDMSEIARKLDGLPRAIAKAYREAAIMGAQ